MESEIPRILFKLCCKNITKGIAIKPEKETALPIVTTSLTIEFWGVIKNWKTIKNTNEVPITNIMFKIKSLNVEL